MGQQGFWDDQQRAAKISTEHSRLTKRLDRYARLRREYDDARELLEMDGDLGAEIGESLAPMQRELERLQEEALFNGEYDEGDAVVTIVGGTGGTDAQDWAEMVLRMYLRWAADRGFQTELLEASPGEEAGLKSATFSVRGENAYGTLKAERGVHRLVRLSPFDQAHRRHTSFAQVIVSPLLGDDADVEIDDAEIRVDTYRASGAGGQHVNKTDSAVRITHRAHRHRRPMPERALAALEPADGDARPQVTARGAGAGAPGGRARGGAGPGAGHRVRKSNPQLCAPPVPAGQGSPDELRDRERAGSARRESRSVHPLVPPRERRRTCGVVWPFGYTSPLATSRRWCRRRTEAQCRS